jgi:mannose-6-phosphate isomerase-like protein (cupin superfamily)
MKRINDAGCNRGIRHVAEIQSRQLLIIPAGVRHRARVEGRATLLRTTVPQGELHRSKRKLSVFGANSV